MRLFLKSVLLCVVAVILLTVPVFAAESATGPAMEPAAGPEKDSSRVSEENQKKTDQAESGQTSDQASRAIKVESTDGGLVISWPALPETENYMVYRAEDGGKLKTVALVGPEDVVDPDADYQGDWKAYYDGHPDISYPIPAVRPAQAIKDEAGQITRYTYTDSLILPGKSYQYYILAFQDNSGTWSVYDREGTEGVWDVTAQEIRAGTQLTEEAVRQLGEDSFFDVIEIDADSDLFQNRMYGKSYKEYCNIPLEDLRYIRCLHRDIDDNIKVGELVVYTGVADDVCKIFHELYRQKYPIESMLLVDDFDASDEWSIMHNNTSAFNYRTVDNTAELSNHAFGKAIDINPYYNVYWIPSENYVFPLDGGAYLDRTADFPYKLTEGDQCYRLFTDAGFEWGGYFTYNTDYQHFYYPG